MKKLFFIGALFCSAAMLSAFTTVLQSEPSGMEKKKDNYAEITFDTLKCNLGTFSTKEPVQQCTFYYTNTGTAPLVIHQALASCGCTVPTFTKTPVKPGEKGQVDVTYNGTGKFPGHFQKTITVRSNAQNEVVRLVIEGEMTDVSEK